MQRFVAGRIFRVANFSLNWNTVNKETVKYKQILNLKIHQFQAVTFLKLPRKYPKTINTVFLITILILDFSAFQHLSVFKFCIFSKFKS